MKAYGLSFGYGHIPEELRRKFKERRRFTNPTTGATVTYLLIGITDSQIQLTQMIEQASNGKRLFKTIVKGEWTAIYCY